MIERSGDRTEKADAADFEMVAITDTGRQRSRNEDNYMVHAEQPLCVVADGMGGHADGNIASSTAVTTIMEMIGANSGGGIRAKISEDQVSEIRGMIDEAKSRIFAKNRGYFSLEGMGTTIVVLMMTPGEVITANVGDSRIYRLRAGKLKQLTQDHSLLEELKRFNIIGSRDTHFNINKNIITRALGMNETVNADLERHSYQPGDLFLLCSDGLTDLVEDPGIEQVLVEEPNLEAAADRLVALANENGGNDNITVVLARLKD